MTRLTRSILLIASALFILALFVAFLMRADLVLAGDSKAKARATSVPQLREAAHHLHAAMFSTRDGLKSTLVLNNSLHNKALSARITLYNKQGESLTIPEITLPPTKNAHFNIADWLTQENAERFAEGSLKVSFHGPSKVYPIV